MVKGVGWWWGKCEFDLRRNAMQKDEDAGEENRDW
jgi:hypothetical protein